MIEPGSIAVACCYRYEPEWLVDEWHDSVQWADDVIAFDTRGHDDPWIPREQRVQWMIDLARQTCEWLLILDVDERLSPDAEYHLRELAGYSTVFAYKFKLMEMFTPTQRRVDGTWGKKTRRRFFHIEKRVADMQSRCTYAAAPVIFHTQHLDPENDAARAAKHNAHNTWDRAGRDGSGFDYLNDRTGMVLETVPAHLLPAEPLKPWRFEMREQ